MTPDTFPPSNAARVQRSWLRQTWTPRVSNAKSVTVPPRCSERLAYVLLTAGLAVDQEIAAAAGPQQLAAECTVPPRLGIQLVGDRSRRDLGIDPLLVEIRLMQEPAEVVEPSVGDGFRHLEGQLAQANHPHPRRRAPLAIESHLIGDQAEVGANPAGVAE